MEGDGHICLCVRVCGGFASNNFMAITCLVNNGVISGENPTSCTFV